MFSKFYARNFCLLINSKLKWSWIVAGCSENRQLLRLHTRQDLRACSRAYSKRNLYIDEQRRKVVPMLIHMSNPWTYLRAKFKLWQLKYFWDCEFNFMEFIGGAKMAASVMMNLIRTKNWNEMRRLTTTNGLQDIAFQILEPSNALYIKLMRFDRQHWRRVIPLNVSAEIYAGRTYINVDILFLGLRNVLDFESSNELLEIKHIVQRLIDQPQAPPGAAKAMHRVLFGKLIIGFQREYPNHLTNIQSDLQADWLVNFYKVCAVKVINYNSMPIKYRILEFLNSFH